MTFSNLISPWITLFECKYAIAFNICPIKNLTTISFIECIFSIFPKRSPSLQYSEIIYTFSLSLKHSYIFIIFGCSKLFKMSISSINCLPFSSSFIIDLGIIFIALIVSS